MRSDYVIHINSQRHTPSERPYRIGQINCPDLHQARKIMLVLEQNQRSLEITPSIGVRVYGPRGTVTIPLEVVEAVADDLDSEFKPGQLNEHIDSSGKATIKPAIGIDHRNAGKAV